MPKENVIQKIAKKQYSIFWMLGVFFLGGFLIFLLNFFTNLPSIAPTETDIRIDDKNYTYINPLLECNVGSTISDELKGFKDDIQTEVNQITASGEADNIGVYFRDMNNGPWFAINETEQFFPASLLKVPVMMAYYKEAENNPAVLQQKITFATSTNTNVEYFDSSVLVLGQTYTVEQLIHDMIVDSDNDALDLLLLNATTNNVNPEDTFQYLNVSLPANGTVTPLQYSTFFRILFNSSYLDYDDSEKALSLLADSTFTKGLRAGVPANIPVAHKFGEEWSYANTEKELHDCGIIYYPNHPYLLCVMTEGKNLDQLASVIAEISHSIYQEVNTQEKSNN